MLPLPLTLADLEPGQHGVVLGITRENETLKRRLTALGMIRGAEIVLDWVAPMGNPCAYRLRGYRLSLRNEDARNVLLSAAWQPVPRPHTPRLHRP
ncbi:FeoA family protein [Rhodovastum atsumiense]|uniref:FeoA family protein n=1 Tax=Rhodovastum atsumiense TaxID=504468 RepID=UPI00139F2CC5|nr:FeoA family protein [Rhodovastum atsumiense]